MSNPIDQVCQLIVEMLRDDPELDQAELVARVEGAIDTHPDLAALKANPQMLQINRDAAKGFQTWVEKGGTVFNDGIHYHSLDLEKIAAVVETILQKWQSSRSEAIDFQPYLQSILSDQNYQEWQDLYTPTTVEDRQKVPQQKFSPRLKLRAETVKPKEEGKSEEQQEQVEQWDVLAGLRHYAADHVLLMGKPGSGKSTSLERLLWEEAENAVKTPDAKIPVLVKLRRCTSTIEALIQDFLSGHQLRLEESAIKALLQQGKFLLLLDGLNELPEAFRTEIANFRDRYRKTTPMIVSTRELSVGGTLDIPKTLKMLPLTERQMQEFVRGYLGEAGNKLFQQLAGDRLRKFAETPLLLWMLCRVFAENGQVPANLGLAFREFARLYDEEIQQDAPADSRDQWTKLLRHLAFALMQDQSRTDFRLSMPKEEAENRLTDYLQQEGRANPRDRAERWLNDLLKYHLIQPVMQPNFVEHIEFRHQLLQEYYAAEALLPLLPTLSDAKLKRDYLNYLKWTEPIALMLALVEQEAQALRVVRSALEVDLKLGARLAGAVKPTFQKQTLTVLSSLEIPKLLKIRLLAHTYSNSVISLLNSVFWADQDADVRDATVNALGQIGSQEAVNCLLEVLENEDSSVYGLAAYWLGKSGSENAIKVLLKALKHKNSYFRQRAADALGEISNQDVVDALCKALDDHDEKVRFYISSSLTKIRSQIKLSPQCQDLVDEILTEYRVLQNVDSGTDSEVYQQAEENNERENELLLENLMQGNLSIRKLVSLAAQLLRSNSNDVLSTFKKALNHERFSVRFAVALSLIEVDFENTFPILLQGIGSEDMFLYTSSSIALKRVGTPSLISQLYSLLLRRKSIRPLYLRHILETILTIQNRCKFYNYDLFQSEAIQEESPQPSHSPATVIYDQRGATIGNLAHEVYGNQTTHQTHPPSSP